MSASAGGASRVVYLDAIFARSKSAACETVRALLHSIVFLRALGVVRPLEQSADLGCGEQHCCAYAAIDDKHVAYRVDRAVDLAQKALGGPFQVVEVEIEFGTFDSAALRRRKRLKESGAHLSQGDVPIFKQVSNWASWLTDSLASVGKATGFEGSRHSLAAHREASSFASLAGTMSEEDDQLLTKDVAKIWERWRFRVYVVDEQTYRQSKKPRLAQVLAYAIERAGQAYSILPPVVTTDAITYPFRTHIREAHATSGVVGRSRAQRTVETDPMPILARDVNVYRRSAEPAERLDTDVGANNSGWWGSVRLSPGSGTWEDGMGLLKDLVRHAPPLSSSPPF